MPSISPTFAGIDTRYSHHRSLPGPYRLELYEKAARAKEENERFNSNEPDGNLPPRADEFRNKQAVTGKSDAIGEASALVTPELFKLYSTLEQQRTEGKPLDEAAFLAFEDKLDAICDKLETAFDDMAPEDPDEPMPKDKKLAQILVRHGNISVQLDGSSPYRQLVFSLSSDERARLPKDVLMRLPTADLKDILSTERFQEIWAARQAEAAGE